MLANHSGQIGDSEWVAIYLRVNFLHVLTVSWFYNPTKRSNTLHKWLSWCVHIELFTRTESTSFVHAIANIFTDLAHECNRQQSPWFSILVWKISEAGRSCMSKRLGFLSVCSWGKTHCSRFHAFTYDWLMTILKEWPPDNSYRVCSMITFSGKTADLRLWTRLLC